MALLTGDRDILVGVDLWAWLVFEGGIDRGGVGQISATQLELTNTRPNHQYCNTSILLESLSASNTKKTPQLITVSLN